MPRTAPRVTNSSPIAKRRIALGITQAQLAERIGCTLPEISRWERGIRRPRIDTLIKIAAVLECPITDLLPIQKEENP